jgi:hypothetical protein
MEKTIIASAVLGIILLPASAAPLSPGPSASHLAGAPGQDITYVKKWGYIRTARAEVEKLVGEAVGCPWAKLRRYGVKR